MFDCAVGASRGLRSSAVAVYESQRTVSKAARNPPTDLMSPLQRNFSRPHHDNQQTNEELIPVALHSDQCQAVVKHSNDSNAEKRPIDTTLSAS